MAAQEKEKNIKFNKPVDFFEVYAGMA